ncbi:MAG TPA: hypothetical protein VG737_05425 [Cyclobacteriaceae bacterium]|nr:hypothetical protein [Cyclobacteriaceae bacterium]
MLEHRSKPLLPFDQFLIRVLRYTGLSAALILICLGIGTLGYHFTNDLGWLDAMTNASMILTGMGPLNVLSGDASKWFATFYSIFSGVAFPSIVALFLTPVVHRFLHKHHLRLADEKQ